MALIALALYASGFVAPPRAHILPQRLGAASRVGPKISRVVAASPSQPDPPPRARTGAGGASVEVDGQVLSEGSAILVADEHGTWWTAVVVDVRSAGGDVDILVHYRGCDPAWDEWLAAASGRVVPQPPAPDGLSASDETWRDVDDGLDPVTDAELLAKLRAERQIVVDQWQYNTLCAAHGGQWAGVALRYAVRGQPDGARIRLQADEWCACSAAVRAEGELADTRTITISEAAPSGRAAAGARASLTLTASQMRAPFGHMAVGGAYTLTHSPAAAALGARSDDEPLVVEIGVAHASEGAAERAERAGAGAHPAQRPLQRVRCTLGYSPFADMGAGADMRRRARQIEWVEVAREVLLASGASALPAPQGLAARPAAPVELPAWATALAGEAGKGLYDPEAQRDGVGLYSLYCAGGLTVVLPTELLAGTPAALSVDWDAGEMRYQADRKFGGEHNGSLLTLELTEAIGSDGDGM
ncbi:hypothetical protein KFE25_009629 [Diacronema lutheri]|uniref:Tudor-knot domain-containing protein n=1 Tax=Diacronema lutheri TaxID=2081491 RepID=A0A8J5XT46_DIALT|nr:hypothetical protein KFE25_009629 [Diacronema lutheri]